MISFDDVGVSPVNNFKRCSRSLLIWPIALAEGVRSKYDLRWSASSELRLLNVLKWRTRNILNKNDYLIYVMHKCIIRQEFILAKRINKGYLLKVYSKIIVIITFLTNMFLPSGALASSRTRFNDEKVQIVDCQNSKNVAKTEDNKAKLLISHIQDKSLIENVNSPIVPNKRIYKITKKGVGWFVSYKIKIKNKRLVGFYDLNSKATIGSLHTSNFHKITSKKAKWEGHHQLGVVNLSVHCIVKIKGNTLIVE